MRLRPNGLLNSTHPFLDWIYVDGDHSYTGAYTDLCNALKAVKSGGLIIGDDYKWGRPGDKGGVKKAANQWAEENGLTLEQYGKNQFVVRGYEGKGKGSGEISNAHYNPKVRSHYLRDPSRDVRHTVRRLDYRTSGRSPESVGRSIPVWRRRWTPNCASIKTTTTTTGGNKNVPRSSKKKLRRPREDRESTK